MRQFDVISYIRSVGYQPEFRSRNRYAYIPCPVCDSDTPHLWIRVDNGAWGCWKSGHHKGGPVHLVMHLENIGYAAARRRMEKFYGLGFIQPEERKDLKFRPIGLPEGVMLAVESPEAVAYLRKRGFTLQTAKDWDLYYVRNTTYKGLRFKQRLIIPIYHKGKVVAFQGRDITGRDKLSYLTSPPEEGAAPLTETVYNIDRVNPNLVVVCEGVMDAWAVGRDCGVCLFGKRLYPEQLLLFVEKRIKLCYVCLDGEAISEAQHIAYDLSVHVPDVRVLGLPLLEDPASLGNREIWRMIEDGA